MSSSRRAFLQTATVGAAWLAAGCRTRAAAPAGSPLSLGFSLYGMKSLPLERAMAECARIGYRNVELSLIDGFPTAPDRLDAATRAAARRHAAASGLAISSLLANLKLTGDDNAHAGHLRVLETAVAFAREINAAAPPVVQTVLGGAPDEWEGQKSLMARRLADWNRIASGAGVTIAVKAHVSSAVNTPDRLLWLLRTAQGSHLAVAYDQSHYALAGLTAEESFSPLAPLTRFVHVKDATRDGANVRFLLPGEGGIDHRALFRLLVARGYRGPVVAEVSSQIFNRPGYDPVAAAEKCHAALAPALPT